MELPRVYDAKKIEEDVSAFWNEQNVVEQAIKYDASKQLFSFLEGPPTANAPPALHHVEMRTFKDVFCRYKFMQGFSVPRKGGWDCHGLPVEVQIEKKVGLKTKKDVLSYGIGNFNQLCRKDVFMYIGEWERLTEKMAFWIDLQNPYVTLDNKYIESVWWSLKQLHEKGLLYESHKVVPYCPRCETPLSSHEVSLGYNEVADPAITAMFRLKEYADRPVEHERYLLAWTTTPWTTPANIALAVGKDITYAVVEKQGKQYVLAKDIVGKYFEEPVIIEELIGEQLVGREYEPLFDYFVGKLDKQAWKVISADFVNTEEGTGIVHQAPAFGEDDYNACKLAGLAFVQPVMENGAFTREVPDFAGMFVKDADRQIIALLEKEGKVFRSEEYTHSYPFCWRCDTPLLYYAITSWFIRVTAFKEQLLANNQKINWYPGHIKEGRFGDWLKNVKDWALSRSKFWGTPLPIWRCAACGADKVVGSMKELKEAAASPVDGIDLHKPGIDAVKMACGCGGEMKRIPDVIDCWYDSGAATFAQFHYPFENVERFEKSFPYSFIAEAIDQTRGWFYTLHVLGTLLFGSNAYKNVVSAGHVVDENGEKMSKSRGNIIDPWLAFDTLGVDAVRLQFCTSAPGSAKRFGLEMAKESVLPFLNTLWNVAVFAKGAVPAPYTGPRPSLQREDAWLLSRVSSLATSVSQHFEQHDYHLCAQEIKDFVDADFSKWYIKLVRERALEDDAGLGYTLSYTLNVLLRLLAPFAPYISEYLWRAFALSRGSVHLEKWPVAEFSNAKVEREMAVVRDMVQALLAVRETMQRGVRWPLGEVVIATRNNEAKEAVRMFAELIKAQANVKQIVLTEKFAKAEETISINALQMESDFGEKAAAVLSAASSHNLQAVFEKVEREGKYEVRVSDTPAALAREHFIVESKAPPEYIFSAFRTGRLYVNTLMDPQLEAEGYTREFIRRAQQFRKNLGLDKSDRIVLSAKVPVQLQKMLAAFKDTIMKRIGADTLEMHDDEPKESFDAKEKMRIKQHVIEFFAKMKK